MFSFERFLLTVFVARYPKDWDIPTSFNFSIYGWGHNHRGQLGGVDGNKVKVPRICDSFGEISPVQITGGEQTLFAVTADGKVSVSVLSVCLSVWCLYICVFTCIYVFFILSSVVGLRYRLWGIWSARRWWDRQHHVTYSVIYSGLQGSQGHKGGSSLWREALPSSHH